MSADDSTGTRKGRGSASDDIPRMPVVRYPESSDIQSLTMDPNKSCGIAYRWRPIEEGGPSFFVYRYNWAGTRKAISKFHPITREGWRGVWNEFCSLYPGSADRIQEEMARAEEKKEEERGIDGPRTKLERKTIVLLKSVVFLGGYSSFDGLERESKYDLRFLGDCLGVFVPGGFEPLGELSYGDFTAPVQIGGPGLVTSVSGIVAPAQSIADAAIGLTQPGVNSGIKNMEKTAIDAIVKRAGTSTKIKTILYMQTRDSELFFLNTEIEPDRLRIDLSPAFGRIRDALGSASPNARSDTDGEATSLIAQLKDAADLVDRGFMTREEFNQLKHRLLNPGS